MLKAKVRKCIEDYQLNLIEALKSEYQSFRTAADIDEEDVRDMDTQSHQSQSTYDEQRVHEQLERAEADMRHLRGVPRDAADIIREGALIETKDLVLYVGIITKKFTEEGKEIIGISTEAPIFKKLVGQKEGFKIQLADKECSIISIQ